MERVIQVINRMQADGVIEDYAIGGGIAAIYYLEPYYTDDLDIFIPVSAVTFGEAGLVSLEPIYSYLKESVTPPRLKECSLKIGWFNSFLHLKRCKMKRCCTRAK